MNSSPAPRVLIASASDWEGLSRAPWLYASAGWHVEAFTSAATFLAHSSHVRRLHAVEAEPSVFADQLGAFVQAHASAYDKIVIGDDPLLWEIARRRAQPWARALLPCSGSDAAINFMISKLDFIRGCGAHGIPVPRSIICHSAEEVRAAAQEVGFPLVLKQDQGYAGEGVRVVHSLAELQGMGTATEVLVQAFVDGQICSAAVLYRQGELAGFFSYLRSRTWGALGASTAIRFRVFPQLQEILEKLGRITQFDGQCGVDFMVERGSGRLLVLEQNFRPTLTMLLGKHVGVDFCDLLRRWNTPGTDQPMQDATVSREIAFFPTDIVRALSERDYPVLLRWLIDPRWMRQASWHDGTLLRHNLRYILNFATNKLTRYMKRQKRL